MCRQWTEIDYGPIIHFSIKVVIAGDSLQLEGVRYLSYDAPADISIPIRSPDISCLAVYVPRFVAWHQKGTRIFRH